MTVSPSDRSPPPPRPIGLAPPLPPKVSQAAALHPFHSERRPRKRLSLVAGRLIKFRAVIALIPVKWREHVMIWVAGFFGMVIGANLGALAMAIVSVRQSREMSMPYNREPYLKLVR